MSSYLPYVLLSMFTACWARLRCIWRLRVRHAVQAAAARTQPLHMGCALFPVELQGAPWLDIKVSWCCLMLQVSVDLYKYLIKIFPKLSPTLIKCFEFPELNIYHVLAVRSRSWSEVMSSRRGSRSFYRLQDFTRWLFSLLFFSSLFSGLVADLNILTPVCPPLFILPLVLTFTPLPTTSPRPVTTPFVWSLHLVEGYHAPTLFCFSAHSPAPRRRKERETRKEGRKMFHSCLDVHEALFCLSSNMTQLWLMPRL